MAKEQCQLLIQAVQMADSPEELLKAVQALADHNSPEAIEPLIAVFGYNNPAAAALALRGIIRHGEVAVPPLLRLLDDYNYGARAYSMRALAAIASPEALPLLLETAVRDFAPSVRRSAAQGLGRMCQGDSPQKVMPVLIQISQDGDWSIRYAAIAALEALGHGAPALRESIQHWLAQRLDHETDQAVLARIQLAQTRLGQ
jgi:phycocyanobilin lyase beta subunit